MKPLLSIMFVLLCSGAARGQATCGTTDVQSAINSASEGATVNIPAGTCSWTTGVTISGKGITVQGAGAGRVIAVDVETSAITLGTGTKTFNFVRNDQGATNYNNSVAPGISNGQTLRIIENGFLANFMQGTVTSFSGTTLVMNVTSSGGTCGTIVTNQMNSNCKRWLVSTLSSTVLTNNMTGNVPMFTVTEDSSIHTTLTAIRFAQGIGGGGMGSAIFLNRNDSGGQAILLHDNWFDSNQAHIITGNTNRGVIWNNTFLFSPFANGQWATYQIKDAPSTSWSSASNFGMNDAMGQSNLYFETNDVHAVGTGTDLDNNARTVIRYNLLDNAGFGGHGADTSLIGARYFEYYNNTGIFEAYGDGSTANMNWWMLVRGGTFVWHDNTLPVISSTDFGSKGDITMAVWTLRRLDQFPCWGAGGTPGQYYPAPRQIGFGYVTGAGTVNYPADGYTNSPTAGGTYGGDSEPAYIWNNSRTMNASPSDNNPNQCTSPAGDTAFNYVIAGRDYFNNGTAKPGYTPYTYPHPLTITIPPPAPTAVILAVKVN